MNGRDLPREPTPPTPARSQLWSWLLVLLAVAILWRAEPLIEGYFGKLVTLHGLRATLLAAVAGASGFALLTVSLRLWPRLTLLAALATAAALALISGNLGSLLAASAILAAVFVCGDATARLVRGREAGEEELVLTFAAGVLSVGLLVFLLGEIRLLGRPALLLCAVGLFVLRREHLRVLARRIGRAVAALAELRPTSLIAAGWIAFTFLVLAAIWVGVLSPEVGWDALAYHLPEVRDLVLRGRVEPLPALAPQTLFWRHHESFLAAGFYFGGEAVVRFLHFAVGIGAFAAVPALVSKLRVPAASSLALLSLSAFPFACYQLRSTYVDWPAAFLVAAAAVAFASAEAEPPRNGRLGAVLFAGAIATKVFALFAAPALALLAWRRHALTLRSLPLIVLLAATPLLPWLAWSESRAGFFLAPYASSFSLLTSRLTGGYFFVSPAPLTDEGTPQTASRSLRDFALLPYSLTYHTNRFERFRDGYGGVFALLILPGVLGWGPRRFAAFVAAALAVLLPWYLLHEPAYRYLLPVYPLYVAFAAGGLWRLTGGFEGLAGRAAAACLLAAAFALPVQLGSSGIEWKVAAGLLSREEALEIQLPSYPLWRAIRPTDRVLFLGEFDLYHCRCERAYRFGYHPVSDWELDPARWRKGLADLGIDYIAYREQSGLAPLLEGLRSDLQLTGENRDARLYRVKRPSAISRAWEIRRFRRQPHLRHQLPQVEAGPEQERQRELERQIEQVLAESPEVAGEGAVVSQAPGAKAGGIDELHAEEDQHDVEEHGRQQGPAEVLQSLPPGEARHGEEERDQHHQVEVHVGHPKGVDEALRRREVEPRDVGEVSVSAHQVRHVRALGEVDEVLAARQQELVVERRHEHPEQRRRQQPEEAVADEEEGPAPRRGLGRSHQVADSAGAAGVAKRLAQKIQSSTPKRMTIVCQITVCELSKIRGK